MELNIRISFVLNKISDKSDEKDWESIDFLSNLQPAHFKRIPNVFFCAEKANIFSKWRKQNLDKIQFFLTILSSENDRFFLEIPASDIDYFEKAVNEGFRNFGFFLNKSKKQHIANSTQSYAYT